MARLIFFILFAILNCLNISALTPVKYQYLDNFEYEIDQINYRLPNNTKPEAYNVFLRTDVANGNFEFFGSVKITIRVLQTSNEITLHQRQLNITNIELEQSDGETIPVLGSEYDKKTEFFTISTANDALKQGSKLYLYIEYEGVLREDSAGFYRSSYANEDGKEIWLATTQFESTDARHAFPCYDEPSLKATFDIDIEHNSEYTAISNMPEKRQEKRGERTITYFEQTPPTSTYLIAFIVSDFAFKEKSDQHGFKYRVFVKPHEIETTNFALADSDKILNAISEYVQVNFTLPKMDQAAIPDFRAGAMENWGLVTYRQELLLFNPSIHSENRKKSIVTTIAHEFGHQWFGNLVSPKWWTYLWLNEGFATLFQFIATNIVHPEWNINEHLVTRNLQPVLKLDARNKTRSMTYYVESPRGIQGLFDHISYAKSGSVLRMFLHAFGESSFKKGLNYYLTQKSLDVADENDLFENLDRAVKEDGSLDENLSVKKIFGSWSNQNGFPLLTVNRNYQQNTIKISQERYFDYYPHPEANSTSYWIPYNFDTSNNVNVNDTSVDGWLPKGIKSKLIKPNGIKTWTNDDWVLFNKQQTGFYRIMYDKRNYQLLLKELNSGDKTKIHPSSRAQLLDDLNDFALTHRLPSEMYFEHIKYLKHEIHIAPWNTAMDALFKLKQSLIEDSDTYKKFRTFVVSIVEPFYQSINWKSTDYVEKSKQQIAIKVACGFGLESCLQMAEQSLEVSIFNDNFAADTRGVIYENGIINAKSSVVGKIWERLLSSKNSEEIQEIISSLGNIGNEKLLEEYLHKSFDSNINLKEEARLAIFYSIATKSRIGLSLALNLMENQIDRGCLLRNGCKQLNLDKTISLLAKYISTDDSRNQLESILKTMYKAKSLEEERSEDITDSMNEAMKMFESRRTIVEEYFKTL
ncbi:aminopeptidase N-like [Contarinia nasturtii]|uniref:aminopeptidase N-like n=1 Tax=Contarinia nasturtii TaxID=265458 RepID=UPI0012D48468|nr:aminopeptidase N-like [Contarinia nasturtii]